MNRLSVLVPSRKRLKTITLILAMVVSGIILTGTAQAGTLVFNLPAGVPFLGSSYSQDGYTFTNSESASDAYGNWVAYGVPQYNAASTPDIFQNYGGTSNTITNNSDTPFSFTSIGLANVFNNGSGGDVDFTFNYFGGGSSSTTVDLAIDILGLQTFNFSQSNLSSVVFTPTTTQGPWIQFDDIGLSSVSNVTPEPSSFLLLGSGILALAGAARRKISTLRTSRQA